METIEYRTIDKSSWVRGPWDDEPDKIQWRDQATGLPCLIVRHPSGHLCGYVGVNKKHPFFGKDYDSCEPYPDVHGGLTFAGHCQTQQKESEGVCHVAKDEDGGKMWWLGFDCAHCGDYTSMGYPESFLEKFPHLNSGDKYRDIDYVKSECRSLAKQLAKPK